MDTAGGDVTSVNLPLGGLPSADPMMLERAPLELVVTEIRFVPVATDLPAELGLRVQERLRELGQDFPRLEPANVGHVSIQIAPGAEPTSQIQQTANGWQLVTADARIQVAVMPGSVVVQSARYERWSLSLRPLLAALITVVEELLSPVISSRVGLRYINRFTDAQAAEAAAWQGRIHDALLGPVCHPTLGPLVRSAQQQFELSLGSAQGALLRHGPFVDPAANGSVSYLLDIDVFDGEARRFRSGLIDRAESLNRTAASLFKAALTPEYFATLRGNARAGLDDPTGVLLGEPSLPGADSGVGTPNAGS